MELNKFFNGDCLSILKTLPSNSIDCCVTSPPYYALRDYGIEGQLGLENTPEEYIAKMTEVFMEVYRVLKPEGTLWLNIGDSYNGYKGNAKSQYNDSKFVGGHGGHPTRPSGYGLECKDLKPKDLIGIPWMLAFSLRNAGWYLRQDIIWNKPNPMPESVTDRCTKSHEYIFLFSKSRKYYFDYEAIQEPCTDQKRTNFQSGSRSNGINKDRNDNDLGERSKNWKPKTKNCQYDGQRPNSMHLRRELGFPDETYIVRNKRDVWSVNVKPCKEAHFATYPTELIIPCILAGCPEGGVVLDPFMGAGTTAIVAKSLDRNYLGIELNPEYIEIANNRMKGIFGMFL